MCIYLLLILYFLSFVKCEIPEMTKYYCIVGAGPSGLQMAYFLHKSERDYIVFEQADGPGNFFQRYPRHRKLISKNIRETGSTNKEYNLRYDLNSLISEDKNLLFTQYSQELFPAAQEMIHYLKDYQEKLNLTTQFNTRISDITYNKEAKTDRCRYTMRDQQKYLYCCRNIFIATGWQKIKIPSHVKGIEYAETYEIMSIDPENYKDQTVLIVGRGFSGFETALALHETAKDVHMVSSNKVHLNFGMQGALKGLTKDVLENLDGFFEMDISNMQFTELPNGKIQVSAKDKSEMVGQKFLHKGYDRVILCLGFQWDDSILNSSMKIPYLIKAGIPKDMFPDIGADSQAKEYPGLYFIGPLSHALDHSRMTVGGFIHGGIHGFRHTVHALHTLVEWKNHGVRWPSVVKSIDQFLLTLVNRINEAAGIYNAFGHLCDLAIYDSSKKQFTYLEEFPISLIPQLLKHSGHEFNVEKNSAFVLVFEHGENQPQKSTETSPGGTSKDNVEDTGLRPVIYYYKRLPTVEQMNGRQLSDPLPNPDLVHYVPNEHAFRSEKGQTYVNALIAFLEEITQEKLPSKLSSESCVAYSLTYRLQKFPSGCDMFDNKVDSALMYH